MLQNKLFLNYNHFLDWMLPAVENLKRIISTMLMGIWVSEHLFADISKEKQKRNARASRPFSRRVGKSTFFSPGPREENHGPTYCFAFVKMVTSHDWGIRFNFIILPTGDFQQKMNKNCKILRMNELREKLVYCIRLIILIQSLVQSFGHLCLHSLSIAIFSFLL